MLARIPQNTLFMKMYIKEEKTFQKTSIMQINRKYLISVLCPISVINCFILHIFFFFFFQIYLFFHRLIDCYVGSSFLCQVFLQLRQAGATLHRGARASHCGLSCCRAQAPDAQAQQLWLTGPVAPRHVGSSQTRARTRVPCISRQTLNHCTTREAAILHIFIIS